MWRFVLPPGMCGPHTILGLWMPSVDRVGRYFPFMIATSYSFADPVMLASGSVQWLEAAEEVGRNAIADDVNPGDIVARLPPPPEPTRAPTFGFVAEAEVGTWWTEGSPRVPAQTVALDTMPDVNKFVTMLDAVGSAPEEAR